MRTISNDFKYNITTLGRQITYKITYTIGLTEYTLGDEQLNSVEPVVQGDILKSSMKELYIDSNVSIPINTQINVQFGVFDWTNEEFEYLDFGNYYVTSSEYQEDMKSYYITCYDKMILAMKEYDEVSMIYPTTVRSYLTELCNTIGITFANASDTFANYDQEVPTDLYKGLGYTYRDALDELAEVTASIICINDNDELEIRYITDTNETLDAEFFDENDVRFKKKYGKINSIVLSRSAETDNVYLRDEQSVLDNGLCEIKIIDNQIMNFNNRSEFLQDILDTLDGLEFYTMDVKTKGVCFLELGDRYTIEIGSNSYTCVLLNDDININQGLEEHIYIDEPETSETDYKKADKTDLKINQTNLIVNKQEQTIEGLVSATRIISNEITSYNSIQLENAYVGTLHYLSIKGNLQPLTPSNTLYPSNDLFILEPILLVDETEYKLDINYLNYISDTICDEFVYEEGKCKIIRRVGVDGNGNLYQLSDETEEIRNDILIEVDYNSTIRMKYYNNLIYTCAYLIQNDYTDTFAPTIDLVSKINLSPGQATIEANKISLAGKTINLTSDNIAINSTNFNLDKDGNMQANSGTFSGTIATNDDCLVGNNLIIGANQNIENRDEKSISLSEKTYIQRTILANHEWAIINSPMISSNIENENGENFEWLQANYGTVQISNPYMVSLTSDYQGVYIQNDIVMSSQPIISSDRRLKSDIKDVNTDWINDLKVKEFEYKKLPNKKQIGLIAQDYKDKDYAKYFLIKKDDGYYGINYGCITNALIDYCQRLSKRVDELENKIKEMEGIK